MDSQRSEAVPEEACFACYEAVKTHGKLEGVGGRRERDKRFQQ